MSTLEDLFASSTLEVVVPYASIECPVSGLADEWLATLETEGAARQQAFFDERLHAFLLVRIGHPNPDVPAEPTRPPKSLVEFLVHLQVSLEATYIAQEPQPGPDTLASTHLSAPPQLSSSGPATARPKSQHPSIYPPNTPHPVPSAAEADRKYVRSEGILLLTSIWGESTSDDCQENFSLVFSEADQVWVAVFDLSFIVSFLRLPISDPLLCLTVSATLRERPITNSSRHPFLTFFASIDGSTVSSLLDSFNADRDGAHTEKNDHDEDEFEEINLLEGLSAGLNFSGESGHAYVPSARLGDHTRQQLFSLPPFNSVKPGSTSLPTAKQSNRPILRKSFRTTLQTVSGFRVRMRTVFVPYVILPGKEDSYSTYPDAVSEEQERMDAGNNERTIVLCVEVENSGESGAEVGFAVQSVDVKVGGDEATATLIPWGGLTNAGASHEIFPLLVGSMEQYNLLYAVSFLHSPNDVDGQPLGKIGQDAFSDQRQSSQLQRPVTINITGRPYTIQKNVTNSTITQANPVDSEDLDYPTRPFTSRWNCVLDLSNRLADEAVHNSESFPDPHNVLPEPPSPFPTHQFSSNLANNPYDKPQPQPVAGSKCYTIPENIAALRALQSTPSTPHTSLRSVPSLTSTPSQLRYSLLDSPSTPGKRPYTPPAATSQYARSPTSSFSTLVHNMTMTGTIETGPSNTPVNADASSVPPLTPAYPAFSPGPALPSSLHSEHPISLHQSSLGPSVEIHRERGNESLAGVPQTPGPTVTRGTFAGSDRLRDSTTLENASGAPIVVSVGLLPLSSSRYESSTSKIYPYDRFTLDIFIFNKSTWVRRFEISYPDNSRQRRRKFEENHAILGRQLSPLERLKNAISPPGIIPLQNRVRIGPLLPSACQSVRMDFLALTPGVHSIDSLTLTDIQTDFTMNLRSVMDIVVHEPQGG